MQSTGARSTSRFIYIDFTLGSLSHLSSLTHSRLLATPVSGAFFLNLTHKHPVSTPASCFTGSSLPLPYLPVSPGAICPQSSISRIPCFTLNFLSYPQLSFSTPPLPEFPVSPSAVALFRPHETGALIKHMLLSEPT